MTRDKTKKRLFDEYLLYSLTYFNDITTLLQAQVIMAVRAVNLYAHDPYSGNIINMHDLAVSSYDMDCRFFDGDRYFLIFVLDYLNRIVCAPYNRNAQQRDNEYWYYEKILRHKIIIYYGKDTLIILQLQTF